MQYRNVGGSGLKVSEIALGSWMTRLEDAAAVDIAMDLSLIHISEPTRH